MMQHVQEEYIRDHQGINMRRAIDNCGGMAVPMRPVRIQTGRWIFHGKLMLRGRKLDLNIQLLLWFFTHHFDPGLKVSELSKSAM